MKKGCKKKKAFNVAKAEGLPVLKLNSLVIHSSYCQGFKTFLSS